jgi:stage IV sporulation protein FB
MEEPSGLRLGSIGGTSLYAEASFLILAVFFVAISAQGGQPMESALLWIPTLFFSILIHELGHAGMIAALGFGRSVIVLGGFGGVTMNSRSARPWQNILISLAGPVCGFLLSVVLRMIYVRSEFLQTDRFFSEWFGQLVYANIAWAIFNLIPIYPLDGGQIFRNLTMMLTSDERSFIVTTWVSMILAGLLLVYGIANQQYFLATIAFMLGLQNFQSWSSFKGGGGI